MLSTTHRTKFSYLRRVLVLPVSFMVVAALSVTMSESKAMPVITPVVTRAEAPVVIPVVAQVATRQKPKAANPVKQPVKKVIKNDTTPTPGKATITILDSRQKEDSGRRIILGGNLLIRGKMDSTKNATIPDVIYYIDGLLASGDDVKKLSPDQIRSIHVWKGETAVKKWGANASNGVIEIVTKLVL